MGRSNKVRHRFRLFFFKRTILLLIHHQFLQFWYQCIKKTFIYHIIGNFPQTATATHGKRTKSTISSNPQSWPVWMTFELSHYVLLANHHGATSVRRHSLTSFGILLEDFLSSKVIYVGKFCREREREGRNIEKSQFYKLFNCTVGPMVIYVTFLIVENDASGRFAKNDFTFQVKITGSQERIPGVTFFNGEGRKNFSATPTGHQHSLMIPTLTSA